MGPEAPHPIETADEIQSAWLNKRRRVGITTGASTDEEAINDVTARLESMA